MRQHRCIRQRVALQHRSFALTTQLADRIFTVNCNSRQEEQMGVMLERLTGDKVSHQHGSLKRERCAEHWKKFNEITCYATLGRNNDSPMQSDCLQHRHGENHKERESRINWIVHFAYTACNMTVYWMLWDKRRSAAHGNDTEKY